MTRIKSVKGKKTAPEQQARKSTSVSVEIDHLEWELGKICHLILDKETRPSFGFKNLLNIYNTTILKLIKDFIEPLTRSFSSTLPDMRNQAFYELTASISSLLDLVSYSPICSTSSEKSPVENFLENNALVFGTLIMARLAHIHAKIGGTDKYFGYQAYKYAQWFSEKYREVRKADRSSKIFEYIFRYYTAPIAIEIRQDNDENAACIENIIINSTRGLLYHRACRVLLNNNFPSEDEVPCRFIQDLHESCGEPSLLWQLNVLELYAIDDKFIYCPENFMPANLRKLILNINKFLHFGDYLLSSIQCWRLAKMFFVGSHSGLAFTDMAMDMTRGLIDAAMKLDHMAYMCGERYEPFHKVLHEEGSLLSVVMSSYERRVEKLKRNILQLLKRKRCDDVLANELALPLLQEVAFYEGFSGPAFAVVGLKREDYLDILLYARLLNPWFSIFALKAILLKHGSYMHQLKHDYHNSEKLPEFIFGFLLICYPILNNEQFIKNMLPSVNFLDEKSLEDQTFLRKHEPLLQRIKELAQVCSGGTQNGNSIFIEERSENFIDLTCERAGKCSTVVKDDCYEPDEKSVRSLHVTERKYVNLCRLQENLSGEVETAKIIDINILDSANTMKSGSICVEQSYFSLNKQREHGDFSEANKQGSHQTSHLNSCESLQGDSCRIAKKCPNKVLVGSLDSNKLSIDPGSDNVSGKVPTQVEGEISTPVEGEDSTPVEGKVFTPVEGKVSTPLKGKVTTPIEEEDELVDEKWSIYVISILSQCELASDTMKRVERIANNEQNEQTSTQSRHNLLRLRSYEDVLKVCQGISHDLLNAFPCDQKFPEDKQLITTLKRNLKESLAKLIEKNQKTNCHKSSDDLVPAFEDVKKLGLMFQKLIEVPDDDQESLVNWIQYVATIL